MAVSKLMLFANPYLFAWLLWGAYQDRGRFAFGGEWAVPALVYLMSCYLREKARLTNYGDSLPRPLTRFTEVSEDGMVSVPSHRAQELLLYMADLEDFLERY